MRVSYKSHNGQCTTKYGLDDSATVTNLQIMTITLFSFIVAVVFREAVTASV
jgi:hypothetical protein